MLITKDLHKIYKNGARELHVLKGINLQIENPSMVCIVGPSGAGKSTLLHLLGGLDKPTEGQITIDGVDLYSLKDAELSRFRNKKIGFVFQFYHLLPEFTALENVMLPALVANSKDRKVIMQKARSVLDRVGLIERLDHKPSQLSGGEQQRVAIARALMNDPQVLFCDEPTGNLDSKTGESICQLLCSLSQENKKSVVIVTHEEKIANRANKVFHIKDGIIN